jgi:hypothetical protein
MVALVFTPGMARAQQRRAAMATLGEPRQVTLGDLPQVPAAEAAALAIPSRAPLHGVGEQEYAAMKQALAARARALAGTGSQSSSPAPTALEPSSSESLTPGVSAKFAGLGYACGRFIPPDMALAVGPTYVLQAINGCVAVHDKSGNIQPGFPKSLNAFMLLGGGAFVFDPRALYDWANNRYIVAAGHVGASGASFVNVAVSQSSDPRGGWFIYRINLTGGGIIAPGHLGDFPTLGQDRRGIYVTFNDFLNTSGPSYSGPIALLLPKLKMYAGQSFKFFYLDSSFFMVNGEPVDTLQPANVMNRGDDPRAEFMVNTFNFNYGGLQCITGCQGLVIWAISNPLDYAGTSGPEVSSFVMQTTNTYYLPSGATQPSCANPSCLIDTGDVRISGEVTYASGSLYAALATNGTASTPGAATAHVLWFQVKPFVNDSDPGCTGISTGKCPHIIGAQKLNEVCWDCGSAQGSGGARFYPTVQPDPEGNVTVVFNYSDDTTYPSSVYASNRVTQTLNTMHDGGQTLQAGLSFYERLDHNDLNRWGDYTAVALDLTPGTRPSMWFAAEASNAAGTYRTAIGRNAYTSVTQP